MNLDSIKVVLVATSHPGNIGSTARAMKTMGIHSLVLVTPRSFPHPLAHDMAAGADDVLNHAAKVDSLAEALNGCELVIGTSVRPRGIDLPGLTPITCAELVNKVSHQGTVAIVFGREHAGLTNDELLHCHYHVTIPSNPDFGSLNLAQAVQIIAYELRMKWLQTTTLSPLQKSTEPMATAEQVEKFYEHLREVLIAIDFLKLSNPKRLVQRLRRLFNRAQLELKEVNILRGILSNIQYALERKARSNPDEAQ